MLGGLVMMDLSINETIKYNKSGPARYCCRTGVWSEIEKLLTPYGKRTVVSGGVRARASIQDKLFPALEAAGIEYRVNAFSGESSMNNVEKLVEICREYMPDFIIGAGGGKALDTAKYAAEICGIPVITIPTIAATCAAASNQIIVYSDDGEYLENVYPKTNPPLVIVDPEVILRAPKKYLISGIYDSLAKWYEGSASLPGSDNADTFEYMALAIAGMLKENLFRDGKAALDALDAGELTKEFINVVNLNIYTAASVQALGIKAVRNGIAHSTQNGLTKLPGGHHITHGEKVAYGIAVQLAVLNAPASEKAELKGLYDSMGLVSTFRGLDLDFTDENIHTVALKAVSDVLMRTKPFDNITVEMMCQAIREVEVTF